MAGKRKDMRRIRGVLSAAQGGRCGYCGREMTRPRPGSPTLRPSDRTIDHKVPLCRGGVDAPSNLVVACNGCNIAKGCLTDAEFLETLRPPA